MLAPENLGIGGQGFREGADGPEIGVRGLRCLVLTTFQSGAEGGEELDVGVVAGCDCVQVKGGKEEDVDFTVGDKGVLGEEASALVDGRGTPELRTTW